MSNTVQIGPALAGPLFKLALNNFKFCLGFSSSLSGSDDLEDNTIDFLEIRNAPSADSLRGYPKMIYLKLKKGVFSFLIKTDPSGVCISDLNGDGFPDLVAPGPMGASFVLGEGEFEKFRPVVDLFSSSASGDLNGDGILDLVTTNYDANKVSVHFGNVAGGFEPANNFFVPSPRSVGIGDFNGDGSLDVIIGTGDLGKLAGDEFGVLFNQAGSVGKAAKIAETSSPSTALIAVVAVVGLIAVAAVAFYLYRKSQQHKSVKSSQDTSETDTRASTPSSLVGGLFQRGLRRDESAALPVAYSPGYSQG